MEVRPALLAWRLAAAFPLPLALLAILCFGSGCRTIVHAPDRVQDAVTVYLVDDIIHSGMILPCDDNGLHVEYVFGDWDYAAEQRHDPFHAARAVFLSPQSGLGRRYFQFPPGSALQPGDPHLPQEFVGSTIYPIQVERLAERNLVAELNHRYDLGKYKKFNETTKYEWSAVPDAYALWSNCNTLAHDNLRKLNCQVSLPKCFGAYYQVVSPPPPAPLSPTQLRPDSLWNTTPSASAASPQRLWTFR